MICRLVRSEDFERVLRARTRARSEHFAVHHIADRASLPGKRPDRPLPDQLSTTGGVAVIKPVDDSLAAGAPALLWLGAVVPKRHARRAVTRSLLKRQIRAVALRCAATMPGGLWVVRLRAPFDRGSFASAASGPLKQAARAELEHLMHSALQPAGPAR